MTNYDEIDFSPLDALADGEVITHSFVTDVRLASGKTLALITRGVGAWPLHVDQLIGSFFVDAGNAWGPDVSPSGFPNARHIRPMLTSVGAEVTTEVLGLYNVELRLRTGVAVQLREGRGASVYLRIGLPF